jgi:hypothetical protein
VTLRATILLAFAALALAACATPREHRAADVLEGLSHVIVAPLNISIRAPAELDGEFGPMRDALLGYFHAQDRRVSRLSPISAERLWLEATLDLDVSDQGLALRTACSRFARGLAEHQTYDILVFPSLLLRPALMHGRYASWDGVRRLVPNGLEVIDAGLSDITLPANIVSVLGLRGKVAAASLHVEVYLPDGTLVHQGLGGLDVIQEADRGNPWDGRWRFALRGDPFANPDHLREGIEGAFERPLRRTARNW